MVMGLQVPVDDANKDGSRPSSAHLFTTTGKKKDGNMRNGWAEQDQDDWFENPYNTPAPRRYVPTRAKAWAVARETVPAVRECRM